MSGAKIIAGLKEAVEHAKDDAGRWKFEVYENGQVVAEGDCFSRSVAIGTASHYVMMYGQDGGDVKSLVWTGRKPKLK